MNLMKLKEVQADSAQPENKNQQYKSISERTEQMKKKILLIALLIAGAIVGAIAASGAGHIDALKWLAYSQHVSVSPFTLNLVIISLTFGFDFSMSVSQILFMVVAITLYPKFSKMIG